MNHKERNNNILIYILPLLLSTILTPAYVCGQTMWDADNLPFMPKRNKTHLHTVRKYELSNQVMGKRTLLETTYWDRHGYELLPNTRMAFDSLGRLTDRLVEVETYDADGLLPILEPLTQQHVEYGPEGVVRYFRTIEYKRYQGSIPDTEATTYRLIDYATAEGRGIVKCVYRRSHTIAQAAVYERIPVTTYDTLVCECVLDGSGRLIQQYVEGTPNGQGDYQRYFYYDDNGRRIKRKRINKESIDSIEYQYNIMSELIGWTGKGLSEGTEFDIFARCQPNGTMTQRTVIWHIMQFDEISEQWMPVQTNFRTYFDERGNVSRTEEPDMPFIEFDNEYWEE